MAAPGRSSSGFCVGKIGWEGKGKSPGCAVGEEKIEHRPNTAAGMVMIMVVPVLVLRVSWVKIRFDRATIYLNKPIYVFTYIS
jgi:hypothetical protein